jgi:hypothetical protein
MTERDFIPIVTGCEHKGHLWKYTDVTEKFVIKGFVNKSEEHKNHNELSWNATVTATKGK